MCCGVPQARLGLRHRYVGKLEEWEVAGGRSAVAPVLGALSVAAQQQHTRRRELEAELERLEGQLRIEHRWQPDEANYTEVQSERKHFNIWQRQQAISEGRTRYFAANALVARALGRRHEVLRGAKLRSKAREGVASVLKELQEWEAAPGESALAHSAEQLTVEAVLEEEAMLPWEAAAVGVSGERQLPLRELEALRQKRMRATEELCSVRREVDDVVRFYEHRIASIGTALENLADGSAACLALPQRLSIYTQSMRNHYMTAWQSGAEAQLKRHLERFQGLLRCALRSQRGIQALSSGDAAAPLPSFMAAANVVALEEEEEAEQGAVAAQFV